MKQLDIKYRQNNLTPKELQELRKMVNELPDSEIESSMYESWQNDSQDEKNISAERLEAIKAAIYKSIAPKPSFSLIKRIGKIAAAVLIPLFMFTTFYFYKETKVLSEQEMIVSTSRGERATITLLDGTHVTINSETYLIYTPKTFNKSERRIRFEGEAYFDVAKKESLPFVVGTKDLEIKVLGTKFNLLAREKNKTIELVLEEGHVLLFSSKETKELFVNQRATLDRSTGSISIASEPLPRNASAWKQGELVFGNARLKDVLKSLENNYGVHITIDSTLDLSEDLFSGTITARNLLEALEVIKISYQLEYTVIDNEVMFVAN